MAAITSNRVAALRGKLGLTQRLMARMLGVTERTLIALEGGREPSEPISRRLTEMSRLQRQLSKVVKGDVVGAWLARTNPALDDDSPVDVVAKGKIDLLWQMIFELRAGVSS